MMNQSEPYVYYSSDTCDIVAGYVDDFRKSPSVVLNDTAWLKNDILDFMIQDLREHKHAYKVQCKKILSKVDIIDGEDEEALDDLIEMFSKDESSFERLVSYYEGLLLGDTNFLEDYLDFDRINANDMLKVDGFIGNHEGYIILGANMGWRHLKGVKELVVDSIEELEQAVTGDYEHTIRVERDTEETPWITCHVYSHDAPTGEVYYCIPYKWLDEALKDESIKSLYDSFKKENVI